MPGRLLGAAMRGSVSLAARLGATFGANLPISNIPGPPRTLYWLYATEWGARVRIRGGEGRVGQATPPAWRSTRSR